MAFIVDITKFQAEGALLNWPVVARRLGMLAATTGGVEGPVGAQTLKVLASSETATNWRVKMKQKLGE